MVIFVCVSLRLKRECSLIRAGARTEHSPPALIFLPMYTTIIHPLRRAYCLSPNEYFVLDAIYHLSHIEKEGFWCIASQQKLAESLQMDRTWINQCMEKLEGKGLIKRRRKNPKDTAVRTTDEWNQWHNPANEKYLMYLKTESVVLTTGDTSLLDQAKSMLTKSTTSSLNMLSFSTKHVDKVNMTCRQSQHNTKSILNYTNKGKIKKLIFGEDGLPYVNPEWEALNQRPVMD